MTPLRADRLQTLVQVREFLAGDRTIEPRIRTRADAYRFIERTLARFDYFRLGRNDKGVLRQLIARATGLSRAQITRLLHQHRSTGKLTDRRRATRRSFARHYTRTDVELLAELDTLHGTPSGPVARVYCHRACYRFGDRRFERLAGISNSHLYNLRRSAAYRMRREKMPDPVHPVPWTAGERWRPGPFEQPGHVRVASAVQRDLPGTRGVSYLTLVDEVTQFQLVQAVEDLTPPALEPLLEALHETFPFRLQGFHAGPGAEPASHTAAALLRMLHGAERSDPRAFAGDDAYAGLPQGTIVERVNIFARQMLAPYLNYHRLCFFRRRRSGPAGGRGERRHRDTDFMTPYDRLRSLPGAAGSLAPDTTFTQLDAVASAVSDNGAARAVLEVGERLLSNRNEREKP